VEIVGKMLGHRLITKQTPKEGIVVKKVMIAESVNITRETYICILMDWLAYCPYFMSHSSVIMSAAK
jgi:succinyl-CoA synthetase beta subunit